MGMFSSLANQATLEQLTEALEKEIEEIKKTGNHKHSQYAVGMMAGLKRAIEVAEQVIDTY